MAGTVLQTLSIVFETKTDKLAKGLSAVKSAVSGTAGSVEGAGKRFDLLADSIKNAVQAAAGMAVIQKSAQYIKDGLADVFEEIELTTKLTTVMRQRMKATDATVQRVIDLADAQKQLGVVDDMVLVAGAQQVATFLNTGRAVETLLPAMGNLLAQQKGLNATSEDAVNIGNMFGKVMQGQTSALTRVGITFTKAQEQVLLYGTELERAQMLSQVVTDNVGQMSAALGGTLQGRLLQLTNILGDVRKGLGDAFAPIVAAVLPALTALARALLFVINCMAKFSAWMAKLFGVNMKVASSADGVAASGAGAAEAIEKEGEAAGGAAKKTQKLLSTLDQLNEVNKESGGGGGGGGDKVNDVSAGGAAIDEIAEDLEQSEASLGELILGAGAWGLAIAAAYNTIKPLVTDTISLFKKVKNAMHGASEVASAVGDVAEIASSAASAAASTAETAAQSAETAATKASTAAEGVNAAAKTISAAASVLGGLGSLAQALGLAAVGLAAAGAASQFSSMATKAEKAKTAIEAIDDNADTTFTSLSTSASTAATGLESAMKTAADNAETEFSDMGTAGKNAMSGVSDKVTGISVAIRVAGMVAKTTFSNIGTEGVNAAQAVGSAMQGAAARTQSGMQAAANAVYALITALKSIPASVSTTVNVHYTTSGVSSVRTDGFGGGSSSGGGTGRKFASGTVTNGPQMALIGEAGTEAVVPLEGANAKSYARRYPWLIREFARIWDSAGVQRMANGGIGGVRLSGGTHLMNAADPQGMGEEIASAIIRALGGIRLDARGGKENGATGNIQLSVDGYHLAMTVIGAIHSYERVNGLKFLLR